MNRPDAVLADELSPVDPAAIVVDWWAYDVSHPSPFVCALTVGERSLSRTIEHVSNIEYVRWLDRAAELHSDAVGYTRNALLEKGLMWFVARHEIDYLAETWRDDQLLIATWVKTIRKVKSWREYVILRPEDETVICRASTLWVLVDLKTRRPKRIPDEMYAAFDVAKETESPCTSL